MLQWELLANSLQKYISNKEGRGQEEGHQKITAGLLAEPKGLSGPSPLGWQLPWKCLQSLSGLPVPPSSSGDVSSRPTTRGAHTTFTWSPVLWCGDRKERGFPSSGVKKRQREQGLLGINVPKLRSHQALQSTQDTRRRRGIRGQHLFPFLIGSVVSFWKIPFFGRFSGEGLPTWAGEAAAALVARLWKTDSAGSRSSAGTGSRRRADSRYHLNETGDKCRQAPQPNPQLLSPCSLNSRLWSRCGHFISSAAVRISPSQPSFAS